jgi:hypothetical protein
LGTFSATPTPSKIVETLFDINLHFASDRIEDILVEQRGAVTLITPNRPQVMTASPPPASPGLQQSTALRWVADVR